MDGLISGIAIIALCGFLIAYKIRKKKSDMNETQQRAAAKPNHCIGKVVELRGKY
jgi:hypothetical protein